MLGEVFFPGAVQFPLCLCQNKIEIGGKDDEGRRGEN